MTWADLGYFAATFAGVFAGAGLVAAYYHLAGKDRE